MSKSPESIWFQLGYALELARRRAPAKVTVRKRPERTERAERAESSGTSAVDQLLSAGTGIVTDRLFAMLSGRSPGTWRVTRAALAGAAAAFATSLLRQRANGSSNGKSRNDDPAADLLAGAGRGILYSVVLEPRLPGSPLLRGATFGVIEYIASPFGGLDGILGASSPHRTAPLLAALLRTGDSSSRSLAEHIAFGVTLGFLYGDDRVRIGRRDAE